MSPNKRFILSVLYGASMLTTGVCVDAAANPNTVWLLPGCAVLFGISVIVFTGMLWHGDDK